jgi:hypothetical protein
VDSERAETYLRLVAEAELRHAAAVPTDGARQWHAQRLVLAAQALSAVGAIDAHTADEIQSDLDLAVTGRRPLHRRSEPWPPGKRAALGLNTGHTRPAPWRESWRVVPVGQVIPIRDGDVRRELLIVTYIQSASGARFTMAGRPLRRFTAEDDPGAADPLA